MKLTYHRHTHARSFRSAADFARHARAQKAKFNELEDTSPQDFNRWATAVARNWGHAIAAAERDGADEEAIQTSLTAHPVFDYASGLTDVLRARTTLGPASAAEEIIPFLSGAKDGVQVRTVTLPALDARSAFMAALMLETSTKRGKGHASFDAVVREHEERLEAMLSADAEEIEERRTQFADMLDQARASHDKLEKVAAAAIKAGREQWNATHDDFLKQLTTETAVKLWRRRAALHETKHKAYRAAAIWFGSAGIIVLLIWIFGGFALARAVFDKDTAAQIASYTAGSIALFTLYVWGLRVLIRSMMSEDHLQTDASARSALAHTYQALIKLDAATPEDRAIVLASLFAPVSDGLVKDDGMPTLSPMAMAAHALTNPKSAM